MGRPVRQALDIGGRWLYLLLGHFSPAGLTIFLVIKSLLILCGSFPISLETKRYAGDCRATLYVAYPILNANFINVPVFMGHGGISRVIYAVIFLPGTTEM